MNQTVLALELGGKLNLKKKQIKTRCKSEFFTQVNKSKTTSGTGLKIQPLLGPQGLRSQEVM